MRRMPRLNRRMVLETPIDAPDGAGGILRSWVALGEKWVELRPLQGKLAELGDVPVALSRAKIVLRSGSPTSPSRPRAEQRFREGTRVFLIDAVADLTPAARYLVCHVREEVAQ